MATPSTADTKDLIVLAERMGIPVDEAMRQLAQRIADVEPPAEPPEVSDAPSPQVTAEIAIA
jgi:hypothetical protein